LLRSLLRWVLTAVAVSLAAWMGSWPLTAFYFHLFSPVTLLANLLIVPLSSAALASNLGGLICGGWFPWATELFNHSAWFWMWLMVEISRVAVKLPGAFYYVPSPTLADFVIYYGLLFGVLSGWLFSAKRRLWTVAALVVIACLYFVRWRDEQNSITVTVVPLSGGSSVFCDAPGRGSNLLVDCGNTNAVKSIVVPFLYAQGVNSLPRLLLTHGDVQNVGGTQPLCEKMPIGEIVTSDIRFRSPAYRHILSNLPHYVTGRRTLNRGDNISGWVVLHPDAEDKFPQADDGAVVLLGDFHGVRVLLLSDLGKPGQNVLMERNKDLRADIVIGGLPEEGEPLSDALLDVIQPKTIIVVDSEWPATRRADQKLQARLEGHNVYVIYTRTCGAAKITISNRRWELNAANGWRTSSDTMSVAVTKPEETKSDNETPEIPEER
jgi:beta-lactamase superfamily II metal-dependent hydrolase